MGTIDISYLSLSVGLLLLIIPIFYLWKFKTGLVKATLVGTARMIVQLFFIGIYLQYFAVQIACVPCALFPFHTGAFLYEFPRLAFS